MKLSVCIITLNEEANIGRTLKSVQPLVADGQGEVIVVDSGSTDRTVEIAKSFGAKVFTEPWKGFAAQKNSAIEKAQGEWILSLDADEEVSGEARQEFLGELPRPLGSRTWSKEAVRDAVNRNVIKELGGNKIEAKFIGFYSPRKNLFLDKWMRWGGFYPDKKLRFFRRGWGMFESRRVHEDVVLQTPITADLHGVIIHHAYPTLSGYIEHMNKYSSLGAEMEIEKSRRGFSLINIVFRPWLTFIYNYFFRLGFLDGKEGLLLHMYHAVYVSWKYAKVWELSRKKAD